jgi:hypothetical protein
METISTNGSAAHHGHQEDACMSGTDLVERADAYSMRIEIACALMM